MKHGSELARLRAFGWAEGVSFLLLLFIAMPLKHFANFPQPVRILGSLHGALFILYVLSALLVAVQLRWKFSTIALALLSAVVPFGPFVFDAWLRRQMPPQIAPTGEENQSPESSEAPFELKL